MKAEKVYKSDLGEGVIRSVAHPDNIWSLVGLNLCYKFLGKNEEMEALKPKIEEK